MSEQPRDRAAELAEAKKRLTRAQRQLREQMEQLAEASRRAAEATRALLVPLTLEGLGLTEWDAEMDNCYPGFD